MSKEKHTPVPRSADGRFARKPKLYVRYRIDASVEMNGNLHDASELVEEHWYDSEDEAIAYARSVLELAELYDSNDRAISYNDKLILTVDEYMIESTEEPSDYDDMNDFYRQGTLISDREIWQCQRRSRS